MRSANIDEAVSRLGQGGLVIYPTETFFGLGCLADDEQALSRVFQIKKRLLAMPLPLIVADWAQAQNLARLPEHLEADAQRLQALFWPGPLSLILPAQAHLSALLTGGTGKVALRVSPHPTAAALAAQAGCGLVSSSANISGKPPVTRVEDLDPELAEQVDAVVDAGPSPSGGLPSTIVEPKGDGRLLLLRPGALAKAQLEQSGFIVENANDTKSK